MRTWPRRIGLSAISIAPPDVAARPCRSGRIIPKLFATWERPCRDLGSMPSRSNNSAARARAAAGFRRRPQQSGDRVSASWARKTRHRAFPSGRRAGPGIAPAQTNLGQDACGSWSGRGGARRTVRRRSGSIPIRPRCITILATPCACSSGLSTPRVSYLEALRLNPETGAWPTPIWAWSCSARAS